MRGEFAGLEVAEETLVGVWFNLGVVGGAGASALSGLGVVGVAGVSEAVGVRGGTSTAFSTCVPLTPLVMGGGVTTSDLRVGRMIGL